MADPSNMESYNLRFAQNQRIEGYGMDVKTVLPCPFCAAADFLVMPITDPSTAMKRNTTCKECGRSAQHLVEHSVHGVHFEIVQTGGPDPADYLPKMRRV